MDLLLTAAMWQFKKPAEVHIGIYNSHPQNEPVSFDIRMREFSCTSCLPNDFIAKNEVFNRVHEGTDAHLTSDTERS